MGLELHLLDKQREDIILSDTRARCLYCFMINKELIGIFLTKFWLIPIILKRAVIS